MNTPYFPVIICNLSKFLAVILIDWNHSYLETSLLRLCQSYLPQWRKRNIRQDVYICLFGIALTLIYGNCLKNFVISFENCRILGASLAVFLSFWLQSKSDTDSVSDKCVGTPVVPVSDKSVGGSAVTQRDQETGGSTCCGAGVPRYLASLPPSSSEPQSAVNIEEELSHPYVEAFRTQVDEEEVTLEELITAIQYLNTLKEGITAHRSAQKLIDAVDHIQRMGQMSRLDDSGFPQDYTYEELHHIVVVESGYPLEDFDRVVEKCLENSSYLPSPEEFAEIHHDMKVQLEKEVAEKDQEICETRREMEETLRVVEETTQEVRESRQKNQSLRERLQQNERIILQRDQALQQRDQTIQQKDRMLQQERQRVRMLEERNQPVPEGEWQKRLRELEEENRRLSAQSDRAKCKICHQEEVQVSFTPCNHLISCQGCVDSLPERVCPLCRQPIQGTVNMFFA
ncbi:uncharacterized protein LOC134246542 [Saccostrea cucullata]|uniref:uncharacterized protein LOC134246542 n=1 Tax=Saccostrea cuccullata TaxID=36930 RepID=UPI002ED3EDEC